LAPLVHRPRRCAAAAAVRSLVGHAELQPLAGAVGAVRRHDGRRAVSGPARKSLPRWQAAGAGKDWWGTVIGFQPPGSVDFHHTIRVRQLLADVDVHIHYSFEPEDNGTRVNRWLVLDITIPVLLRPLRGAITAKFERENVRTMAAVKEYAEVHPAEESATSDQLDEQVA
jgi:hypothetical protein